MNFKTLAFTFIGLAILLIVIVISLSGGEESESTPFDDDRQVDTERPVDYIPANKPQVVSQEPEWDNVVDMALENLRNRAISGGLVVAETSDYQISYSTQDDYFSILLLQPSFSKHRVEAEEALMEELGLSKNRMCTLHYSVGVPQWASEQYSGVDFRFSFCQDSVSF